MRPTEWIGPHPPHVSSDSYRDGFDLTICPVCQAGLALSDGVTATLRCGRGHAFDLARQGYVNLLGRAGPSHADTAAMIAARERFHAGGWYLPIAQAIADAIDPAAEAIVEVGAGTAYYLSHVLDQRSGAVGLATDISVAAAKRAAKAHPRIRAVVADTWAGLPIAAGSVDAIICAFAPRNPAEFRRILAPHGRAVIVAPAPDHLSSLRESHGLLGIEPDKIDHLVASMSPFFDRQDTVDICFDAQLSAAAVTDLIAMGPNAFHGAPHVDSGELLEARVTLQTFSPRHPRD